MNTKVNQAILKYELNNTIKNSVRQIDFFESSVTCYSNLLNATSPSDKDFQYLNERLKYAEQNLKKAKKDLEDLLKIREE